jgi:tetratricopeptide (TPR) repeat protein
MRLVAIVIALAAGFAAAQPSTPGDRKKAESHFKMGQAFYNTQQWDKAIGEYQSAWDISHEPALQFSIGLAFHKKGDLAQALQHYLKYIDLDPDGVAADEARAYIAELTPKVEAEAAARRDAEARKHDEVEAAARAERERASADSARAREAARTRSADDRRRARLFKWTGIGVAAAGALFIVAGVKYGLDASDIDSEISEHTDGPWTDDLLALDREGHSAQTKQIVFTSIGGAALLGGGILYYLGHRAGTRAEAAERGVALHPGPGVGVAMTAHF